MLRSPGIAHPSFSDIPLLFAEQDEFPRREVVLHNLDLIERFVRDFSLRISNKKTPPCWMAAMCLFRKQRYNSMAIERSLSVKRVMVSGSIRPLLVDVLGPSDVTDSRMWSSQARSRADDALLFHNRLRKSGRRLSNYRRILHRPRNDDIAYPSTGSPSLPARDNPTVKSSEPLSILASLAAVLADERRSRKENRMNIEEKTVLITGANRGIGRALVNEALRRGVKRVYAGPAPHCKVTSA